MVTWVGTAYLAAERCGSWQSNQSLTSFTEKNANGASRTKH